MQVNNIGRTVPASKRLLVGIGVAVAVLLVASSSYYTVGQSERGVVLRNGAVIGQAQPGLGFKIPFIEKVVMVPVSQQSTIWACNPGENNCSGRAVMNSYSQDQQPADLRVSVLWHVDPSRVSDVYAEYQTIENLENRLIARKVPQDVKTVFGHYTATEVVQKRAQFNTEVAQAVEKDVDGPVIIDSVQMENIQFSEAYEAAVEARMQAQVEVQKLQQQEQQAEITAKITVVNAQAQADSQLAQARASAQAVILAGDAEAHAIKARGDALKDNQGLPTLVAAEKWDGHLPGTMVPGSTLPFISVGH